MIYHIFIRADLQPLQREGLVSRKGPQRFSVRHVSYRIRDRHCAINFSLLWRQADRSVEEMEYRSADSRRRSAGPHGKARHADDGGVLIVGSVAISTLLWARLSSVYMWTAVIATLLFAAIGFADDYAKMAKKQSLGLTGRQKLIAQFLIAARCLGEFFLFRRSFWASDYSWNVEYSVPEVHMPIPNGRTFIGPYLYLALIISRPAGFLKRGEPD